ncbi:MAG: response regulator [Dehalococcoidia bacterium]|nr:response regulator [Dehalococcoidia bacterium]
MRWPSTWPGPSGGCRKRPNASAGGNFQFSAETRRSDEVGDLTRAFGQMVGRVKVSQVGLEERAGELLIANEMLEAEMGERQRVEAQFLQAQEMESVGRLAGGVAHDFNNLLTAIPGYSQMGISGVPEGHPSAAHFREVEKAAQRAAGLTRQLLAFSRHQIVEAKVVDLNQLVMGMHSMLRRLIGENVDLATLPSPDLVHVKVDAGQMEQVVMNLVVNARDAMPDGGKIAIQTENVVLTPWQAAEIPGAAAGLYVMLAISDTGTGMTDEVKAHLFEPFFATKGLGKGTGLGLATCYGIVRRAEGHIQVESRVGQGAKIKIYLPAVASGDAPDPVTREGQDLPRGTETVLVADDEPELRARMARTLGDLGYTVLEAGDGEEARRVAQARNGDTINLLVADMVMPKLGGVELAREFKAQRPDAKVLFVSGYSEDPVLAQDDDRRGMDFMQKPFLPATLARKVRELLDRS